MFQSRSFRSSPGTYLRCSLNSTEKPWYGLACRPARKPSTMNLARRSSRATWRITSGLRYFSVFISILDDEERPVRVAEPTPVGLIHARRLSRQNPAQRLADRAGQVYVFAFFSGVQRV